MNITKPTISVSFDRFDQSFRRRRTSDCMLLLFKTRREIKTKVCTFQN